MKTNNDISRITVDIPAVNHRRLRALSAVLGKSMRHLISQAINDLLEEAKIPNDLTLKTFKDAEKGIGVHDADSPQDLFDKLGI